MSLTLYTRHGCHLCEDFEQELRHLQQTLIFELQVRNVDTHPDWVTSYSDKVPLLLGQIQDQDVEICRYFFDPQALQAYLGSGST